MNYLTGNGIENPKVRDMLNSVCDVLDDGKRLIRSPLCTVDDLEIVIDALERIIPVMKLGVMAEREAENANR